VSKTTTSICITPAIFDRPDAAKYLSLSLETFSRGVQSGDIPKPRQLAGRRVGWLRKDLDAWAESRPVSSNLPVPNCGKKGGGHV